MPRKEDPNSRYHVSIHAVGPHRYASTQSYEVDPVTGKKKYHHIHWGTVNENFVFTPGRQYIYASITERAKLIFPPEWDLSALDVLASNRKPGRPSYDATDNNRLYGHLWLLGQVAQITGIRHDLEVVFDGHKEIVDDILTLAFFPYLTGWTYNRVARWQKVEKAPSDRPLTPKNITLLTQHIDESQRMELLRLRAGRLSDGELCAVDSTSRSAYGRSLADIRWGKNKENLPLEQTVEVVIYTLDGHMPVNYRTFPGNMPDSRSLETIVTDLSHAGFPDVILVTDRGYKSMRNLENCISKGRCMIAAAKVQQHFIADRIEGFGDFAGRPDGMAVDAESRLYHTQFDLDYEVAGKGPNIRKADRLRLNLYFDPVRRGEELLQLDIDIAFQREELDVLRAQRYAVIDAKAFGRQYRYFNIGINKDTSILESFELDEKKIARAKKLSGFFAIVTHKLDMNAMEVFTNYHLRDEQEKYFQQMKNQMVCDRQRNWSEEGKTGRLFILFVSMIISSYVRHIWKATFLKEKFSSSLEVVDEMRTIRCIEHTGRARFITPFIGKQVDICQAFDFEIPDGCATAYVSRKKEPKRRGRPRKKVVEIDS